LWRQCHIDLDGPIVGPQLLDKALVQDLADLIELVLIHGSRMILEPRGEGRVSRSALREGARRVRTVWRPIW